MFRELIRFIPPTVAIILITATGNQFGQKSGSHDDRTPALWGQQSLGNRSQNDPVDSEYNGHSSPPDYNNTSDPPRKETDSLSLSALPWESVGPGGGGSQYSPTMAPNHPNLMYGICDMGGFYRSVDGGHHWSPKNAGLGSNDILDMAGGMKSGQAVLYCLTPTGLSGGALTGGVYRSLNGGDSWAQINGGLASSWNGEAVQYTALGVCATRPDVAYVGCNLEYGPTIYRTSNGGDSWVLKLIDPGSPQKPPGMTVLRDWITLHLGWGWGGEPHQVKVCATNPEVVAFSEDGRTFRSDDGGNSWFCCNNEEKTEGSDWWKSVGFEITPVYGYFFDPFQANRHYIPYTDIGMARSEDAGESWRWSANGSPWRNTFYDLCFDPEIPGRMWAVASDNHDLPHHKMLRQDISQFAGGVLLSEDWGASWTDLGHSTGLPMGAATSIVLDPFNPTDKRRLWVTVLGHGVYKSDDGGLIWTARNTGLGMPDNMNAWRLLRLPSGTLYVAVTMAVDASRNSHKGGLFRSDDGGDHWSLVNVDSDLNWIVGLSIDSRKGVIYVGCFNAPQIGGGGGYRSRDGGASWEKILDKTDVWKITPDPQDDQHLWACVQSEENYEGEGLLLSEDNGNTWFREPGFPFTAYGPQQVHFDPGDPSIVYVTTFGGGVWKAKVPTVMSLIQKRRDAMNHWSELQQRNHDSIKERP